MFQCVFYGTDRDKCEILPNKSITQRAFQAKPLWPRTLLGSASLLKPSLNHLFHLFEAHAEDLAQDLLGFLQLLGPAIELPEIPAFAQLAFA